MTRATGIAILLALLVWASPSYAQAPPEFRWLEPQADSALWRTVQRAFQEVLTPNPFDPTGRTYRYKYLKTIGMLNGSALVIVGYRTREHPPSEEQGAEYFRAFNFNLDTGRISPVVDPEQLDAWRMWDWKLIQLARFEPSAPDVVFTYLTCWECKPERMLSAFRYDSTTQLWRVRRWGIGRPLRWTTPAGIVIAKEIYEADYTVSYDCIWGLFSSSGDGLNHLAARCREVREPAGKRRTVNDVAMLYSFRNGHFTGAIVGDWGQRIQICKKLCGLDGTNKLCQSADNR